MNQPTTTPSTLTAKQVIDKLLPLYTEIETLTDDAKEVLSDAKAAGLDGAMLSKVAKAKVSLKLGELTEKTEKLLELIDSL